MLHPFPAGQSDLKLAERIRADNTQHCLEWKGRKLLAKLLKFDQEVLISGYCVRVILKDMASNI